MKTSKSGRIHLVFMGGIFLLLIVGLRFIDDQSYVTYRRSEMEALLTFDYKLEGYYLLLLANELNIEEGISYGSLEEYRTSVKTEGEFVIEFCKNKKTVEVIGYYKAKERQRYSIKIQQGDSAD
jgi:hypothetical protein